MNKKKMENQALGFAREAHEGQLRKYTKEPYIEHPKRVAETVREVDHTSEMICAAYLHDVVEDTPVSSEEIEEKFGRKVAFLVEELTDEYMKEKYPHLNRKKRKELEVARQAKMTAEAQTIKLADVIDNTSAILENDPDFSRKYIPEMEALVAVLEEGDPALFSRAYAQVQKAKKELRHLPKRVK